MAGLHKKALKNVDAKIKSVEIVWIEKKKEKEKEKKKIDDWNPL